MKLLLIFTFVSCHYNLGHRLGGDVVTEYPENTLQGLSILLQKYKDRSNFRYVEFDVQETADSNLFVFHDKYINRIIPINNFGNKNVLGSHFNTKAEKIEFTELNKNLLLKINLTKDSVKIPELEHVFSALKAGNYTGKTYVEIKKIETDVGRRKLIDTIIRYQNDIDIYVLAIKGKFKNSFPDTKKWCREFNEKKIPVIKVGFHSKIC